MLNNWSDLGGINAYCNVFGCSATTFYTNTTTQTAYQACIKFVVNRYKSSSAILPWELCNQPRCHGCGSSVIYHWASTTSAYIKGFDKHAHGHARRRRMAVWWWRWQLCLQLCRRCGLRQEPGHLDPRLWHLPHLPRPVGLQLQLGQYMDQGP